MAPFAMKVLLTGIPVRAAESSSASPAPARITPLPAITRGEPGSRDQLRGPGDLFFRRYRRQRVLDLEGLFAYHLSGGDALWKVDEAAARPLRFGDLEGLANGFRHNLWLSQLGGVLGDRLEEVDQIQDLAALLVQAVGGSLAGDGDYGSPVHVGVRHASNQIPTTWAAPQYP
jgi:hypothetical protein